MVKIKCKSITRDVLSFRILGYTFVVIIALTCILPFWMILSASFTTEQSILKDGYGLWPKEFSIKSYSLSLSNPAAMLRAYGVTGLVTVLGTAASICMCTMAGYVIYRKDFPLRNAFSMYFFFTTLFSGGLVPTYILVVNTLHLKNTIWALFLPSVVSVWNILMVKGFMHGIPFEITEAGKLDGAGDFVVFAKIIVPLSVPVIATISLFTALNYWNDWYLCMLYITDEQLYTLQYYLHDLLESAKAVRSIVEKYALEIEVPPVESMKMSLTIIVIGPIFLVYPFVQKYFVSGLTIGAVKG